MFMQRVSFPRKFSGFQISYKKTSGGTPSNSPEIRNHVVFQFQASNTAPCLAIDRLLTNW